MVIEQGEVRWAELPDPEGSEAGFRRPVVVIQGDALNRSRMRTALCVPLTSNLAWCDAPGNVVLPAAHTGLPKDSVARTVLMLAVNHQRLGQRVRRLPSESLYLLFAGLDLVLGRK